MTSTDDLQDSRRAAAALRAATHQQRTLADVQTAGVAALTAVQITCAALGLWVATASLISVAVGAVTGTVIFIVARARMLCDRRAARLHSHARDLYAVGRWEGPPPDPPSSPSNARDLSSAGLGLTLLFGCTAVLISAGAAAAAVAVAAAAFILTAAAAAVIVSRHVSRAGRPPCVFCAGKADQAHTVVTADSAVAYTVCADCQNAVEARDLDTLAGRVPPAVPADVARAELRRFFDELDDMEAPGHTSRQVR